MSLDVYINTNINRLENMKNQINKSELFKKAWSRNKSAIGKFYNETFAQSLQIIWNQIRAHEITIGEEIRDNQLKEMLLPPLQNIDIST